MSRFVTTLLLAATLLAGCTKEPEIVDREGEPVVVAFAPEDEDMKAAIARARDTLPEFERRLANPPASQTDLNLKARFEEGDEVEHMWIINVVSTPEGFRGELNNDPVNMKLVRAGSMVLVRRDQVSDWMAIDDGKLVGGYTIRVVRDRLEVEERQEFDASFPYVIED